MLERKHSHLARSSVVNVAQVATLDRSLLTEQVATLPRRLMAAVNAGLRLVLDL